MKFFKKFTKHIFSLLPTNTSRFVYNTLLKPKILRKITNFIVMLLISESIKIPEGSIFLNKKDPIISGSLALGKYEEMETKLIREKVKKDMIFVDAGANIGYYTLIASSIVGDGGRVISFEPSIENFSFLEKTIKFNNLKNVIPCNLALSDKDDEIDFFISTENKGDHRIYNDNEDSKRQSVRIKVTSMDNHLLSLGIERVDFIKMDVQGVEWLVLNGMSKILSNNKILMLIEFWPYGIDKSGGNSLSFLNKLRQKGFNIFNLNEENGKLEIIDNDQSFMKNFPNKEYTNIYCVKN